MAGPFPGWTSHGHPIPGVSRSEDMRPPIARCGGPRLCAQCAREATSHPETMTGAENGYREAHAITTEMLSDLLAELSVVTAGNELRLSKFASAIVQKVEARLREEKRPSRVPHEQDDSTIRGLLRAEEVLRGIEHHWPADSVATAIQELRSLRELCSENGLFDDDYDDDEEGGEKP